MKKKLFNSKKLAVIKKLVLDAAKSRFFIGLLAINFLEMLVVFIIALTHIKSGLTIKTHCEINSSVPDCTSLEAPWYYVFNFVVFPLVVFVANVVVALKLLHVKGRELALCWLWLMILVGLVIAVLTSAMLFHIIEV